MADTVRTRHVVAETQDDGDTEEPGGPDTPPAAPSDNLAAVAALLRQAEQLLLLGPGVGPIGSLVGLIRAARQQAEVLVFRAAGT
jgi:hypothetical protein